MEVTKWLKPSDSASRIGDGASVQAVTRVNAEQASKKPMHRPTWLPYRTAFVPKPLTSSSKADGRFDKQDFVYIAKDDEYRCPAGQRAIKRFTSIEKGMTLHRY